MDKELALKILNCPMEENDSGHYTIGGYLIKLLSTLLIEERSFNGKRPFGNSGWQRDITEALLQNGLLEGSTAVYVDDLIEENDIKAMTIVNTCLKLIPELLGSNDTSNDTLNKIKDILANSSGLKASDIKSDSKLSDFIGIDSLSIFDVVHSIYEQFDVTIQDKELEGMVYVSDIYNYVTAYTKQQDDPKPLPVSHWLYDRTDSPLPLRTRHAYQAAVREHLVEAARYAIRRATVNGQSNEFDPDEMVESFVLGMMLRSKD